MPQNAEQVTSSPMTLSKKSGRVAPRLVAEAPLPPFAGRGPSRLVAEVPLPPFKGSIELYANVDVVQKFMIVQQNR